MRGCGSGLLVGAAMALAVHTSSAACDPVDTYAGADAVVLGKVTSVERTERHILWWGVDRWRARVTTTRLLEGRSAPRHFQYDFSDVSPESCGGPELKVRAGDEAVFAIDSYEGKPFASDAWTTRFYSENRDLFWDRSPRRQQGKK